MKPSYRGKNICKQLNLSEEREQSKTRFALPSRGKVLCKALKTVRQRIAEENNIPLEQRECTHEGPCRGTCPRCEAEVQYLERSLAQKLKLGRVATVASLSLSLTACGSGLTEGEVGGPLVEADSLASTANAIETTLPPADTSEKNSEKIYVEEVGEMLVTGDMETIPPPPEVPELLGIVEEPIEGDVDEVVEEGEATIFVLVESDPEFPGGIEALYAWLDSHLRYPELALQNGIEGRVYVSFVVETDGSISNPRLLRDIGGGCGKEAIRLVKAMPKWIPGKIHGEPVRTQFNLPVKFSLPEEAKKQSPKTVRDTEHIPVLHRVVTDEE